MATSTSGTSRILKEEFQYSQIVAKACECQCAENAILGESGGMPPVKI